MYSRFSVQRLSAGSIFKIMFVGLAASLVPLGILFGILAASGFDTVHWNGEALHGVAKLVTGPLLGLLSALMFSVFFGSAIAVGLWVYSKLRPLSLKEKDLVCGLVGGDGSNRE